MRLSSMADYAVLTMTAASRHCGRARVSAAQLAEETGLPVPTVQKLVSRLAAAGLIRSSRGQGGGLKLSRPAAAITLADIVEAVEGPIAIASCVEQGKHDCSLEAGCMLRPHWPVVNQALRGALAQVSLVQLASPYQHVPHLPMEHSPAVELQS
ncbi:SUF system Fe-S cluster assembly regulator [Novosphingobium flavum]|uniref:SUF system Fe-S cluster assembly regulator n=1 Tax=Novosphingobium flavum TaxID=1778672 RepID=A0A7X1FQJ3_9SPHN|nr:SUF system Fe-S cluster assembly regulator [Novosphingobium flavum]MBC2664582.1 SUF system Fe-S cluster assembly regulator [Novosphingobium flavum]